jgi:hypothetical protein
MGAPCVVQHTAVHGLFDQGLLLFVIPVKIRLEFLTSSSLFTVAFFQPRTFYLFVYLLDISPMAFLTASA